MKTTESTVESRGSVVVGDWIVAGTTQEDLDWGQIWQIKGDVASVSWRSGATTPCDIMADDVEVFGSRAGASEAFEAAVSR